MATKKKGEWVTEEVGEWQQSSSVTWRAQQSTSPDGKTFIGVKQYVKSARYEGPSKSGITFLLDENAEEAISRMQHLFHALKTRIGAEAPAKKPIKATNTRAEPKKPVTKASKAKVADVQYVLKKDTGKYLTSAKVDGGIKVSSDLNKAQLFTKERAQLLLDHKLSAAWGMEAYTD